MKIHIQRKQAKCNFCMDWFEVGSPIPCSLNTCEQCLAKGSLTNCFKFISKGDVYQVYFAKNNLIIQNPSMWNTQKTQIFEVIDRIQDQEIKLILKKWSDISSIIKQSTNSQINNTISNAIISHLNQDKLQFQKENSEILKKVRKQIDTNRALQTISLKVNELGTLQLDLCQLPKKIKTKQTLISRSNSKVNIYNQNSIYTKKNIIASGSGTDRTNITNNNELSRVGSARKLEIFMQTEKTLFSTKLNSLKYSIGNYFQGSNIPSNVLRKMKDQISSAVLNTNIMNKCIELVSFSIQDLDIKCYLSLLEWENIEVVKLVKVGLNDDQAKVLLQFISEKQVETIVISNNLLTEQTCNNLVNLKMPYLKNIYIGNNPIFVPKVKQEIKILKERYKIFL